MKIYLAGPLFTEAERAFNLELAHILEKEGHEVYLPQRDTPAASGPGRAATIFRANLTGSITPTACSRSETDRRSMMARPGRSVTRGAGTSGCMGSVLTAGSCSSKTSGST